jgi:cytochrome c oxidase assembly protein subunit 15
MPFDLIAPASAESAKLRRDRRQVSTWLFTVCGMLMVMISLGGATRLTGSGLSIMEWAPLSGALPPLSQTEWERLYGLYQQIPQSQLVNAGIGLGGFKHIFWLEWAHRLWGRLIGVVFLLPLLAFWWRGAIRRGLWLRLAGLFVLGGLQGAVGWFMVASGFFEGSTAVSAYRLVIHLVLALTLYSAILWTALSIRSPAKVQPRTGLQVMVASCCALVGLTIVAGGFVAGLHAGLTYNTYPLMDGRLVPAGYSALSPWAKNLTENIAAVQFDHRLIATLTALIVTGTAIAGLRSRASAVRGAAAALGVLVLVQYALGVTTLLWVVQVALGTAHQAVAVLLLTAALTTLYFARRAPEAAPSRSLG